MPKLATKLQKQGVQIPKRNIPLWQGPMDDGPMGGITYSMLSRFLCCRERFRLYAIEGLKPVPHFNQRMEYGNLWHVCEEAFAAGQEWQTVLKQYASGLCQTYKMEQEQIQHWYNVCKIQFPVYIEFWSKHKDVKLGTSILQEYTFKVPYLLPSGRTIYLRGKWDRIDSVGPKGKQKIILQENKTKGNIEEIEITTQLRSDLQSMLYSIALVYYLQQAAPTTHGVKLPAIPFGGVRYNVVRRPLAGGKHSIRKHQPSKSKPSGESDEEFYTRLGGLIAEEPEHYFHRWNVDIATSDLAQFEQRTFIPLMEQLCDWWEAMQSCDYDPWANKPTGNARYAAHWQHPHGVWNSLNEGGTTELDNYIAEGSMLGLTNVDKLFTELE